MGAGGFLAGLLHALGRVTSHLVPFLVLFIALLYFDPASGLLMSAGLVAAAVLLFFGLWRAGFDKNVVLEKDGVCTRCTGAIMGVAVYFVPLMGLALGMWELPSDVKNEPAIVTLLFGVCILLGFLPTAYHGYQHRVHGRRTRTLSTGALGFVFSFVGLTSGTVATLLLW